MKKIEVQVMDFVSGYQMYKLVIADSKRQASDLLGVSPYRLKHWAFISEPKTPELIAAPGKVFVTFDAGWLREKKPEWYNKVLPIHIVKDYLIKEGRRKYNKWFKNIGKEKTRPAGS